MANVWDVYTVGDVSFIHEVFLGVSHIFYGTGHNVFLQVYMIGMLLGFIWIFIESMIQQKPIALGRFLVAFIIYSALFVPRATVHLEDTQTKKFYTMDNIPLGLAVGSSLVSKVGAGLTHVFEDYFTPVGGVGSGCSPTKTTCAGYLGSLSKIVQIRENLASQPAFLALDRAICGEDYKTPPLPSAPQVKCSIQKSISNYVRHCGVNRFIQNPQLLKSVRNFNDFRYNNFSYNTDLYLWPDKPRTRNCYEAFIDIDTALTKYQSVIEDLSVKPQWLSGLSHDTTGGGDETAQMVTGAGVNHNQIAEILSQMSGASGTTPDVYTYIKNVMLRGPIEDGLMAGYSDVGDARAALMIKSARDQRNIQWAAEENMWISTAKAMATFFEGFVVALVCLIPFVMFMGGLNIMIEYLKVLMWVQLWNPVMAICNLYIQTVASQKVRDAIASSPITDMYVMDSVDEVVQHWIAVGGLMAATTPLLALFILKGSVYTFTTLASKMSGGDHVNEKAVSPDVMQHAPMLQNSMGASTSEFGKRVMQAGGDFAYMDVSFSKAVADSVQSSNDYAISKNADFLKSVGDAFGTQDSTKFSETYVDTWKKQMDASNAKGWGDVQQVAQSLSESMGRSGARTSSASVAHALSMGIGIDKFGLKLGLKGDRQKQFVEQFGTQWNQALQKTRTSMGSITDQNSLARANSEAHQAALNASRDYATNEQSVAQALHSYNEQQSALKKYSVSSSRQRNIGTSRTMKSNQLAEYIPDEKWNAWYKNLNTYEREALGWNNKDDKWRHKTGTFDHNNKCAALEQILGGELDSNYSYLREQFMDRFGDSVLGQFKDTGSQVDHKEYNGKEPDSTIVDQNSQNLKNNVNKRKNDTGAFVDKGDQVKQETQAAINDAKQKYKNAVNMSIEDIEKAQNAKRENAAETGQSYLDDPDKTAKDSRSAKILLKGVGNKEWDNFVEYLPQVLMGDNVHNAALAAFITQGAIYSQGHFTAQDTSDYLKARNEILKNPHISKDQVSARLAALEASHKGDGWMYDQKTVNSYLDTRRKAIEGMVAGGVSEADAEKYVDSFNVLTERGRTGIGSLAKEYLSSGVTPGQPGETALDVRGLGGGVETSEIIKGHTNPQGKENVVSVRQTPLTASLAGVVGNGYNDAETLYKFRNAINW